MELAANLRILAVALALEAVMGYPAPLYRVVGHPVTWMGAVLTFLERKLNRQVLSARVRRAGGVAALVLLLAAAAAPTVAITIACPRDLLGILILAVLCSSLLAQRSLHQHVAAVANALEKDGLAAARIAVAKIVGRNPETLDAAGVARAAIESLAENFSDGVVAPALWIAVGGLAGGAAYKAANTADSMIGHRNARYAAFGWAAARFDDLVNFPASRLATVWLVAAALFVKGADPPGGFRAVIRDARRHRSPNAGWPEAAMAGALDLKLAGPRFYGDALVEDAFMGDGRRDASAADIRRALGLYRAACVLQGLVAGLAALWLNLRV
jgi:adenosylcobinamide-phosphate synthase